MTENGDLLKNKAHEPGTDLRIGESVHGTDDAAAREERAENAEQERGENEPDVPDLHHAALLLHHHRVKKGSAGKPGKQ